MQSIIFKHTQHALELLLVVHKDNVFFPEKRIWHRLCYKLSDSSECPMVGQEKGKNYSVKKAISVSNIQ